MVNVTAIEDLLEQKSTDIQGSGLQAELTGNVLTGILTAISFYLLLSLLAYECKTGPATKSTIRFFCITSSTSSFLACLSEQLELQGGKISDNWCSAYTALVATFYCVGTLSTYTVLWLRQRSFYTDKLLKKYSGKVLRRVSAIIIVGIYVTLIATVLTLTLSYRLKSTSAGGCILTMEVEVSSLAVTSLIGVAISYVIFQICLLFLLVYPLAKNSKRKVSFSSIFESVNNDIFKVIKRLVACSAVCILSAILAGTFTGVCILYAPDSYWSLFVQTDLIVNTAALFFSFCNWRSRMFPFKRFKETKRPSFLIECSVEHTKTSF
ncbi:unnamed protein product [Clavelina lepadiformis]|uniref:Uncharacterized protein n=1 Tax=Clavelina lepadiformis TaxID=159417 RepID=A0ABP0G949_CLALP